MGNVAQISTNVFQPRLARPEVCAAGNRRLAKKREH